MSEKKDDKRSLEYLVIEHNATARIAYELAKQMQDHLPIASFKKLAEKMDKIVIEKHRLPVSMFAPHIAEDLFPIENSEDLVKKLSAGVRSALALAQAPSFPISNPAIHEILATTRREPGSRAAIPVAFGAAGPQLKQTRKGGI